MTEREAVTKINDYIWKNRKDVFWYKIPDLPRKAQHRKPFDVVGCINGKAFAIEFKSGYGKLKDHQAENLRKFADAGGKVDVINICETREINIQLVNDFLDGLE